MHAGLYLVVPQPSVWPSGFGIVSNGDRYGTVGEVESGSFACRVAFDIAGNGENSSGEQGDRDGNPAAEPPPPASFAAVGGYPGPERNTLGGADALPVMDVPRESPVRFP